MFRRSGSEPGYPRSPAPQFPLLEERSRSRRDTQSLVKLSENEYRERSRERYPPKGLAHYVETRQVGSRTVERQVKQKWPAEPALDYDVYKWKAKEYDALHDRYKEKKAEIVKFERSRELPQMHTKKRQLGEGLVSHNPTEVYSVSGHRALRDIARPREEAAYYEAVIRNEHYEKYPYCQPDVARDAGHHHQIGVAWGKHEKATRDLQYHEYYGRNRRRNS